MSSRSRLDVVRMSSWCRPNVIIFSRPQRSNILISFISLREKGPESRQMSPFPGQPIEIQRFPLGPALRTISGGGPPGHSRVRVSGNIAIARLWGRASAIPSYSQCQRARTNIEHNQAAWDCQGGQRHRSCPGFKFDALKA